MGVGHGHAQVPEDDVLHEAFHQVPVVHHAMPERVLDRVPRARDLGITDLGVGLHTLVTDEEVEVLDTPLLRRRGLLLLNRDGC